MGFPTFQPRFGLFRFFCETRSGQVHTDQSAENIKQEYICVTVRIGKKYTLNEWGVVEQFIPLYIWQKKIENIKQKQRR